MKQDITAKERAGLAAVLILVFSAGVWCGGYDNKNHLSTEQLCEDALVFYITHEKTDMTITSKGFDGSIEYIIDENESEQYIIDCHISENEDVNVMRCVEYNQEYYGEDIDHIAEHLAVNVKVMYNINDW